MSEFRKANSNHWYFITMTVVGWIDVFTRPHYADILLDSLDFCQKKKGIKLNAYVIMPNHLHLIVQKDTGELWTFLRDFKSYTAKKIIQAIEFGEEAESRRSWMLHMFKYFAKYSSQNKKYQFWQKSNHPTMLHSNKFFNQKRNYIHHNPVRARLVTSPEAYFYSSANPDQPLFIFD